MAVERQLLYVYKTVTAREQIKRYLIDDGILNSFTKNMSRGTHEKEENIKMPFTITSLHLGEMAESFLYNDIYYAPMSDYSAYE